MTDWIEWNGGECPVAEGERVQVKVKGGGIIAKRAGDVLWWHSGGKAGFADVIAYRVVDAPGASTGSSALSAHPGGTHYSGAAIQPAQFITANSLQFLEGCIVKRAFRHDKPTGKGREDVEKIIHEARLLLELKYGVAA